LGNIEERGYKKGVYPQPSVHNVERFNPQSKLEGVAVFAKARPPRDRPRRAPKESKGSFALIPAIRVAGDPEAAQ
jgi:hypothetical protein